GLAWPGRCDLTLTSMSRGNLLGMTQIPVSQAPSVPQAPSASQPPSVPQTPSVPQSPSVAQTPSVRLPRLSTVVAGPVGGPGVLLAHGATGSVQDNYGTLIPALTATGHRVVAPD